MRQPGAVFGLFAGIAAVLYLLVFYWMDRALILNPLVYWGTLLLPMVGMVMATRKQRSDNGGKITRQEALKTAFLVFVLSMLIFNLFIYVLFNFIDPGLTGIQRQMMEAAGQDVKGLDLKMTPGRVIFGYAFSLIGGFFLAWFVAFFVKK